MNAGFIDAFAQIIRVKRVDRTTLIDTIKTSLISAAKRKFGQEAEVQVHLDEGKGILEVYRIYKVVRKVENPETEVKLSDARKMDDEAAIGTEIKMLLPLEEFGRNAVQTAKQVLMQKVREAERDRIFEDYKDKIGLIVAGTVRQVDRGNILVNLGRAEAYLPQREQIRKERYNQGDTIRAVIIEVDKEAKGPQVILSRASNLFLSKLFEQEVPEIFDGDVEIKAIAREPGGRSKIAVHSRSEKVDAVGSCVGMKGSRVQAVVNELRGEKIDIVNWSEGSSEFVSRALAPAKVSGLRFNEAEGKVLSIVEDDQLSLAIGRDGQNVRLASKLTGWKIELTTVREIERRDRLEARLQMDIADMYGVTPKIAQKLRGIGILTVQKLYKTPLEELLELEGIGPKTAEKLKLTASETMIELDRALRELIDKEKAEEAVTEELFDEEALAPEPEKKPEEVELTEETLFKDLPEPGEDEEEGEEEEAGGEDGDEDDEEDEDGGVDEGGEAGVDEEESGEEDGPADIADIADIEEDESDGKADRPDTD
ncbi:MAG: transcription termination factor NusA [Candidatus Krumholzibacteria bacterium]|nr:transcription termination factor NusA [Candidatus Krumholzibacteria bacterium]